MPPVVVHLVVPDLGDFRPRVIVHVDVLEEAVGGDILPIQHHLDPRHQARHVIDSFS